MEPKKPVGIPHAWNKPIYGYKNQYSPAADTAASLPADQVTRIQKILALSYTTRLLTR